MNTPCIGNKKVWDITQEETDQIWAEAVYRMAEGESLLLAGRVADEALKRQKAAMMAQPSQRRKV